MHMKFKEMIHSGGIATAPVVFDIDAVMGWRPVQMGGGTQVMLGGNGVTVHIDLPFEEFDTLMADYNNPNENEEEDDDFNDIEDDELWKKD